MDNEADKLKLAQDRLLKALADTHCDFVTINRLSEAIEMAAGVDKGSIDKRHIQLVVNPGEHSVLWTIDSIKIREKIAGRYTS